MIESWFVACEPAIEHNENLASFVVPGVAVVA
jgi:hypothetical protein